jgi:hypothetical protein
MKNIINEKNLSLKKAIITDYLNLKNFTKNKIDNILEK